MAQIIKKLQPGGTISSAKTFGWNGHQIEATEENLNKLASASPIAAQMVRDGYQINWDSNSQNLNHVTPEGKYNVKTLGKELRNMKNIDFIPKQNPIHKLDLSNRIKLKYIQSGDNIILADTPETEAFLDRVKYFISGGEGAKKYDEYDLSSTSFKDVESAFKYWNDPTRQAYFSAETKDDNGNNFIDRIKKGIATSQDVEYLNSMGIKYSDTDSSLSQQESDVKKKFGEYGLDSVKHGAYFTIDQDGDLVANEQLISTIGDNIAFNDEFFKSVSNNDFDFLRGKILFGGQLYNESDLSNSDSYLRKKLTELGYDKYISAGDYVNANQLFRTHGLNYNPSNPSKYNTSTQYHDFFSSLDSNLVYESLTGEYTNGDKQLLKIYDPSNVKRDIWGNPIEFKYAEFNADGSFSKWIDNLETSNWKYNPSGIRNEFLDTSYWNINQEDGENGPKGFYRVRGDNYFENSGVKIFRTPDQKRLLIKADDFRDEKMNNSVYGVEVDESLIPYLTNEKLEEILKDESLKKLFFKLLKNPKNPMLLEKVFGIKNNSKTSQPSSKQINYNVGGRQAYLKNGGIVKANKGIELTKDYINSSKAAGFGSKDSKTMDAADWADLTALIADIGSIGLTLAPVAGNFAAAGVGAAGSLATFGADLSRDGFQWRDVGNLAINLGLDAGTLIPGIGTGAKVTKAGKAIKKIAPTLIRAASAWGLGNAFVNTVNKISSGESFTINDIRTIVNGIQGGITLNKIGIKNAGKQVNKAGIPETTKLSGGKGNKKINIEISKSEIEKIENLPASEQRKKYEELLFKKALAAKKAKGMKKTDGDLLEKDTILDYFGVETKNIRSGSLWKPKTWRNISEIPDFKQKRKVNFNYDIRPNTKRGSWLGRVFYGDDPGRIAYNRYMFGDGKPVKWDSKVILRDSKGKIIGKGKYKEIRGNRGKFLTNKEKEKLFGSLYVPINIKSHDEKVYSTIQEQTPLIYTPSFEKGGILKGQYGLVNPSSSDLISKEKELLSNFNFDDLSKNSSDQIKALQSLWLGFTDNDLTGVMDDYTIKSLQDMLKVDVDGKWSPISTEAAKKYFNWKTEFNSPIADKIQNTPGLLNVGELSENLSNINTQVKQDPKFYDIFSKIVSPDALLKTGSFITSIAGADKLRQHQHETAENVAKAKLKTYVDLGTPRYDQSILDRNLNDQLKTIQSVPVISTDQNSTNAANLQKAEMENAARTQYNQELAKYRSDYLTQNQAIDNQNRISRQATEDYNRSVGFEEAASKSQADASFDAQKTQSALNLMYEERAKLAKLEQLRKSYADWITQQNIQTDTQTDAQKYLTSNFADIWSPDKEMYKKYGGDALKYLQSEQPEKYKQMMKERMYELYSNRYNSELENYGLYSTFPRFQLQSLYELNIPTASGQNIISHTNPYLKKGGKIRSTGDQMLIDQNKATHRLVSKLNDNVIELFYKTK